MKTFDVKETNERIMPASGLAIVGAILNDVRVKTTQAIKLY